ncbi:MAG: cation:proton antiporter, partial [Actinobacteria bacterium]|nr:cation:proton antiporter [Actinomycetota bacterium]
MEVGPLLVSLAGMAVFLVGALTVGQRAVDRLLRTVRARSSGVGGAFTVTALVAFGAGALAGLRVDLKLLSRADVAFWAVVLIAVASIGKLSGAYLGGRLARLPHREGLALGISLNARGALEIVVATVGVSLGILNPRTYTVIVMIAIVTSVAAPPLLRRMARAWAGTPEEQARLEKEEAQRDNVLVRPQRVLVPVQRGDGSLLAARVVDLAWPADIEAAVVSVDPDGVRRAAAVADAFRFRPVEREHLDVPDPIDELARHMDLGFGAMAIGAAEGPGEAALMTPLTEALLARTPLPAVILWEGRCSRLQIATGFNRVLLPVVATVPNRAAQELAFSVAATSQADA